MRKANIVRGLCVAAAAALLMTAVSPAASLFRVPVGRASRAAKAVVVGTAGPSSTRLAVAPSGRARIFTDVRFGDLDVAAGEVSGRTVLLSVIGGTRGGRTLHVAGAPRFAEGSRYVLFLCPGEPFTGLAGWSQGVFRVVKDGAGVERVQDAAGAPVEAVEEGAVRTGGEAMTLAAFLDAVRVQRGLPAPPGERGPGRGPRARPGGAPPRAPPAPPPPEAGRGRYPQAETRREEGR